MVTITTRPSRADSRALDYRVEVDGVEIYHCGDLREAQFVKTWAEAQA